MINYVKLSEDNSNFPEMNFSAWADAEGSMEYDTEESMYHDTEGSMDYASEWYGDVWTWSSDYSWDAYWRKKERTLAENKNERFLSDSEEIPGLG